jgi:hypothetical protein
VVPAFGLKSSGTFSSARVKWSFFHRERSRAHR